MDKTQRDHIIELLNKLGSDGAQLLVAAVDYAASDYGTGLSPAILSSLIADSGVNRRVRSFS